MTTITEAYAIGKAHRDARPRTRRTPFLVKAGQLLGRHTPRWGQVRTTVLQVTGLGLIDYGVFEWNTIGGFIAAGVSLLILDTLSGDE